MGRHLRQEARNIKIPNVPLSMQPRPLRSNEHLDGIPNLSKSDQDRLFKANESYKATKKLVIQLLQMGVLVSIEHPANSLFWETSWIRLLLEQFVGHKTQFHHCMHGGDTDKLTTLWSFNPRTPGVNLMEALSLLCDKQYGHKSWRPKRINGKLAFPTKEEAAYPHLLCTRMASIFVEAAVARGFFFDPICISKCNMIQTLVKATCSQRKPGHKKQNNLWQNLEKQ